MQRMKIFNNLEEMAFDSPPVFNSAERKRFFSLTLLHAIAHNVQRYLDLQKRQELAELTA